MAINLFYPFAGSKMDTCTFLPGQHIHYSKKNDKGHWHNYGHRSATCAPKLTTFPRARIAGQIIKALKVNNNIKRKTLIQKINKNKPV